MVTEVSRKDATPIPRMFAGQTERFEHVVERIGLQFRIIGGCALAVSLEDKELFKLITVFAEFMGFRADHQRRVPACGNRDAAALKQRPKAGEVAGVCVVGFVGINDQRVKTLSL